ncbi:stalk domain-containing protein [Saccharibacillus sp. CPCC 101409]|uniref:stalk domain-containing protein n=1 Tax=Saccharibacillus sp. CPCC 101409 TaxID=3058041 RepID=UPI002673E0D3|nr:stalk domain-containing protein [Saccharibacillus sp. CPCC 101409]MDO3408425.1 stalk domain-containing protein [Saccharibacillus sp. CPCC 101409]
MNGMTTHGSGVDRRRAPWTGGDLRGEAGTVRGGGKLLLRIAFLAALIAALAGGGLRTEAAEAPIRVMLNEESTPLAFSVDPVSRQDTTLVQMRPLFEKLGMELTWNQASGTVKAVKPGTELSLKLGSKTATVNGRQVALDYPATSIGGNTLVPLRFVGEATGAIVHWNGPGRQIIVVTTEWMQSKGVTAARVKAELAKQQAEADAKYAEAKAAEKAEAERKKAEQDRASGNSGTAKVDLNKLSGMYYGAEYDYAGYECGGICWKFYTFLPGSKVVVGEPAGGGPENVDCKTDKCRNYSIKNGKLVIQGGETLPISVSGEGNLVINDVHLGRLTPAKAGTKLSGEYISQGYYGLVGITPFTTSWTDFMTFTADGKFTSDTLSIAALDTGAARTESSSSAKTVTGTYTISKNTITLKYTGGKTERYVFDIQPPDKDGVVYVQIGSRDFHIEN